MPASAFSLHSMRRRAVRRLLAGLLVASMPVLVLAQPSAKETTLPKAANLQLDSGNARADGLPILVLFSLPGCPYCESLRRSFLTPLITTSPRQAIVRQIDLNAATLLRGFDDASTTHGEFAKQHGIKFAPVVMLFTADGKPSGEPLVGAMLPDFYGAYLDEAISNARAATRTAKPAAP